MTGLTHGFTSMCKILFFALLVFNISYGQDSPLDRVSIYSNQEINEAALGDYLNLFNSAWDSVITGDETDFEIEYGTNNVEAKLTRKEGRAYMELTLPGRDGGEGQKLGQFMGASDVSSETLEQLGLVHKAVGSPNHFIAPEMLENLEELTRISREGANTLEGNRWGTAQLEMLDEVSYLSGKLVNHWKELAAKEREVDGQTRPLTEAEFKTQFIDRNAVYFENGFGKAELNSIDGIPFVRVLHYGSGKSFVIREGTTIENASEHFMQYIARQHIIANSNRPTPERGRDIVIMTVDEFKPVQGLEVLLDQTRYEEMNRHVPYSKMWWTEYWRAVKKFPSWSSFTFGMVCGVIQGALAYSTGMFLDTFVAPLQFDLLTTSAFTAAWGTVFGSISSMFKNWVNMGPNFARTVKNMTNGILFQYILTYIIFGGAWEQFLNPLTHMAIFAASYLSNRAKPNWYNFAILRERIGVSKGDVKIGWDPISVTWKKSNIEFQTAYMPAFITRFMERTNLGISRTIPAGTALLVMAIPFSEFLFMKYAQRVADKTNHPAAREMAERAMREWEVKKALFKDIRSHGLILKKFFAPTRAMRASARASLEEKYPTVFKQKLKKKVVPNVSAIGLRNFVIPNRNNCVSDILALAR